MPFPAALAVLVLITLLWGTTFVVVKETLVIVPVSLLLAVRFTLGAASFAWVPLRRAPWGAAILLGLVAFVAFATQTLGLETTSASKAAFITGLSVILAPMFSAAWFRNRVPRRAWISAGLALAGLALLTLPGGEVGGLVAGDAWVLLTAVGYGVYVVYLGEAVERAPALQLAGLQHVPMALLAWAWAWPHAGALASLPAGAWASLLYLGLVCTAGVALLQALAQRVVPAHLAALIFVLEPVFAALFAYLLLGERLGPLGWAGAGLVLIAMLLTEAKPKAESRADAADRDARPAPVK